VVSVNSEVTSESRAKDYPERAKISKKAAIGKEVDIRIYDVFILLKWKNN